MFVKLIAVHGITDRNDSSISAEKNENPFKTPMDSGEYSEIVDISDDSGISHMTNDKSFTGTQKSHSDTESSTLIKRVTRVTCKCGAESCRKYLY